MAKVADNTVAFVKEWIEGKVTKRQYMHYYIVKTPHTEFLMKANEQPDLVAIKDHFGTIFIPDDVLSNNLIPEERSLRNPLLSLINDGHKFPYVMLKENTLTGAVGASLSKWKTLDVKQVLNNDSTRIVNIALVQIGDERYITEVTLKEMKSGPLLDWAAYEDVKKGTFSDYRRQDGAQPYSSLTLVTGNPIKVDEVRGAYVSFAGNAAPLSTVSDQWIMIPTEKNKLSEVTDDDLSAILKSRPFAINYGVPPDLICLDAASKRSTFPFRPDQLTSYNSSNNFINLVNVPLPSEFHRSGNNWREFCKKNMDGEIADNLISYIDADDAWLELHGQGLLPFTQGRTFKEDVLTEKVLGYVLIVEERNPSAMNKHVAYIKGHVIDPYSNKINRVMPYFTKVIPAPHADSTRTIEEFNKYVCN